MSAADKLCRAAVEALGRADIGKSHRLAGTIAVNGARPGHGLEIQTLELRPGNWGWSAIILGLGLLADDFREP